MSRPTRLDLVFVRSNFVRPQTFLSSTLAVQFRERRLPLTVLAAWFALCSACTETRPEKTQPSKPAPIIATASAAASVSASAPASATVSAPLPAPPSRLTAADEARFDAAVRVAIEREDVPGAVIVVLRQGEVVFRRAYGHRAKEPGAVPMTVDTIFDLASLTKPIATATSILLLAERGVLRLQDPVRKWLSAFRGDDRVTVEHLLLHTSGLPAGNARADRAGSRKQAMTKLFDTPLDSPVGEKYVYSDVGYALLGEIVEKASGEALETFSKKNIFEPMGMLDTSFRPASQFLARIAPTTRIGDEMLVGKVHDPLARTLDGVAGHAGLFSTADDIARFVGIVMNEGQFDGKPVLSPSIVRQLLDLRPMPGKAEKRSYGLGSMFDGVGHTGFTGTAFWIDRARDRAVILLTSALHPDGKGSAKILRRDIANAAALMGATKASPGPAQTGALVRTGVDALEREGFAMLEGRKIGLITNHTGTNARRERTIDLFHRSDKLSLVAIFAPEHGLSGTADGLVGDVKDKPTGLPVHSLYGKDKRPVDAAFSGIDTLVFDIQDAGTRFYTYITTLGYMLEEAAKRKLRLVVLDRPNPLGGIVMEGPLLDADRESFVGYHRIPVRHGMTVGELARLFNAERNIGADLHVVPMVGWTRSMQWSGTGLSWIPPSPNLRTAAEALLYPGVGLVEATNVSVGRGTDRPFERVGAPYIDGVKLAAELDRAKLAGVRFSPIRFTPKSSVFAGEACGGVGIELTNAAELESVRVGIAIAVALRKLYPTEWKSAGVMTLLGNARVFEAITRGDDVPRIVALYEKDLESFGKRRGPFLLYR
ncbi:MAG: DUF1343 domain-containing protein [Polyangiaceae bacterium]|nr:DUF1343 domain-containing protein [Polyangiaceae bacterium]